MTTEYTDQTTGDLIEEPREAVSGRLVGPADAECDAERLAWHLLAVRTVTQRQVSQSPSGPMAK